MRGNWCTEGEDPKAVQEFVGHSTITETFDRYGHLFPGARDEARARMDAYLEAELGCISRCPIRVAQLVKRRCSCYARCDDATWEGRSGRRA